MTNFKDMAGARETKKINSSQLIVNPRAFYLKHFKKYIDELEKLLKEEYSELLKKDGDEASNS
jgi:hypothetical protein